MKRWRLTKFATSPGKMRPFLVNGHFPLLIVRHIVFLYFHHIYQYVLRVVAMLYTGIARPLQFDDTFPVSGHDRVERLTKLLSNSYLNSKSCFGLPRLLVALLRCHEFEYSIVMMYAFIEGCIRIMSPVVLLWFLQDLESSSVPVWRPYMFAALLGTMNLAQTLIHHVLFFFSMRLGWNWKAATTGLVFQRLFLLSGGKATNDTKSTGKLVNLISNDVSFFEEFSVVLAHFALPQYVV